MKFDLIAVGAIEMNVLFLSLSKINSLSEHGIYCDLLRKLVNSGNCVYAVVSNDNDKSYVINEINSSILKVNTGKIEKESSIIAKGIATLTIAPKYIHAVKKYFHDIKFDLILYVTPPITLVPVIKYFKKRDGARTYLMLKDIFPQNAVDIGLLKKTGIKGIIYKYFRRKEQILYRISEKIGCMSEANREYILSHNVEISRDKVEVFPNCVDPIIKRASANERNRIREKYGIPGNKTVFVYGGNLGKPQNIPFIIECLDKAKAIDEAFFLIVGNGTEYDRLKEYETKTQHGNFMLLKSLPKEEYDYMIASCDVGLIFLDYRFTIPNFPSRILSYMEAGLPILSCTDPNTDVGDVIADHGFGWKCLSNDAQVFAEKVKEICECNREEYGENAVKFLMKEYDVSKIYKRILQGC